MKFSECTGKNLEELPQTWNFLGQDAEKKNFDDWGEKKKIALELEQELLKCSHETEMLFFLNFPTNTNYQVYVQNVTFHIRAQ